MTETRTDYDTEIAEATAQQELDGTAWLHLNPDYNPKELPEPPALAMGSCRSVYWKDLTPAWLVQEYLNRGGLGKAAGIDRLHKIKRGTGGWYALCALGKWPGEPTGLYFVTDAEAADGMGGTHVTEEAA